MCIAVAQSLRIFLVLLLIFPGHCWARDLVFGFIDFPPHFQAEKDSSVGGEVIDLLHLMEANSELRFKTYRYPVGRLYQAVEQRRVDIFVSIPAPEVNKLAIRSDVVVAQLQVVLVANSEVRAAPGTLSGLVAVLRGYEYGGTVHSVLNDNPSLIITRRNNHDSLIKSVAKGRVDYAINYLGPSLAIADKIGFNQLRYRLIKNVSAHIYVAKNLLEREQLLEQLDSLVLRLRPKLNPGVVGRYQHKD